MPVGEALVGRVVNPLGEPIDDKGPIVTDHTRLVESTAPGIAGRQPVDEPLQTGIKAIDAMTPIGRGQRELIIGDRKTGKTAIAIDTILNQKGTGRHLRLRGDRPEGIDDRRPRRRPPHATARWTTRSSSPPAPATRPRLQYIAPYAGCAMAEYFMYEQGKATLCVYDDLSKQAVAYRELSLLAPPSSGPRGVPRRHLLRPLPAARAVGQAGQQVRDRPRVGTEPRT